MSVEIIQRNCDFANAIARWIDDPNTGGKHYTLINKIDGTSTGGRIVPLNIVLFRCTENTAFPPSAVDSAARLVKAINDSQRIFVTVTSWEGVGAVRIAVSNWTTAKDAENVESSEEFREIREVLLHVMQGH